jgi:hypothetical protein
VGEKFSTVLGWYKKGGGLGLVLEKFSRRQTRTQLETRHGKRFSMSYYHPNNINNWNNGNHSHHVYNGNRRHNYHNGPYNPQAPRPPPIIRPPVQTNGISAQEAQTLINLGIRPPPIFPRLSPEEIEEEKKRQKKQERQQVAETSRYADNLRRVPVPTHFPVPVPNVQLPVPNPPVHLPIPPPPVRASSAQDRKDSATDGEEDKELPIPNPDWLPQWEPVKPPRPRQTRDARDMRGAWWHWSTMAGFWSVPNENSSK